MRALVLALTLALAAPASAATEVLTAHEAHAAVRLQALDTLGTLLSRSVGSAPVTVRHCHVSGSRGWCDVTVAGTTTCRYVGHAHKISSAVLVWGERMRCS